MPIEQRHFGIADSIINTLPGIAPLSLDRLDDVLSVKCDSAVRLAVAVFRLAHPEPEQLPKLPLYYPGRPAYDAAAVFLSKREATK